MRCLRWLLVFSEDAHDAALDADIGRGNDDGGHLRVGRLQADLAAGLAIETLYGGFVLADQRHDDFTGVRNLSLLDDDVIAVKDVVVAHGFALHLEDERILAAAK